MLHWWRYFLQGRRGGWGKQKQNEDDCNDDKIKEKLIHGVAELNQSRFSWRNNSNFPEKISKARRHWDDGFKVKRRTNRIKVDVEWGLRNWENEQEAGKVRSG